MNKDTIQKLIKNVKKEKKILSKLIEDEKYSEEIKNDLKKLYKETSKITTYLIEQLLSSNKSKEEIYKEIDNITKNESPEEGKILNANLKQLIIEQLATHRYIKLPVRNNAEFQGAVRSIDGEYMVILYALSKEYLNELESKNSKKMAIDIIVNRFLSDYSIKYYLMGEEDFAKQFCDPYLYFDNNTINFMLDDNNIKINAYLSLVKAAIIPMQKELFPGFLEAAETMYNFSELYLTALLIQYKKHGFMPNIDFEKLTDIEKQVITNCAKKANDFCIEHNIENQYTYKKTR